MEKLLIFIKHNFKFVWKIIEWFNEMIFRILYHNRLSKILPDIFLEFKKPPYKFRKLNSSDLNSLSELIHSQKVSDLEFFKPHEFDLKSLKKQLNKKSFLMMGSFHENKMIGYFFLRFFSNKKCFVGRLIDEDSRGKGLGSVMNKVMYEAAWRMNFRCLSTISKNNAFVMKAHSKNKTMIILKELQNEYLLVEFVK